MEALQTAAAADARAQRFLIERLEAKLAAAQAQVPQVMISRKILKPAALVEVWRKLLKDLGCVQVKALQDQLPEDRRELQAALLEARHAQGLLRPFSDS